MGYKVLVVDDEAQVVRALQRLFRAASFEVATAADGPSALAVLDQFAPDVLISDFRMPVMNGNELVREVLRRQPATVCLLLSGSITVDEPACECLSKPLEGKVLVATVQARLASRAEAA
jgi:DNA-binding response OmpR family regulator